MDWADELASRVSGPQVVNDSKTPSGTVHVGSLRGPVIVDTIARALRANGIETTYLYGVDDMDPMDAQALLTPDAIDREMGRPLAHVPDPAGDCHPSYARHFAGLFIDTFEKLGIRPDRYFWMSDIYPTGQVDPFIRTALDRAEVVRDIYARVANVHHAAGWLPLSIVCPNCGKVGTTLATDWDGETVAFVCGPDYVTWARGCGTTGRISPFGGAAKLPWNLEWAVQWSLFGVTIEPCGKDLSTAGGSRDRSDAIAREVYEREPPLNVAYEFLNIGGRKMSTSKGRGAAAHTIAEVVPPEQLRFLFLRPRPNQAIEFDPEGTDAIPRLFDESDKFAAATAGREVRGELPAGFEATFRYSLVDPAADVAAEAAAFRPAFSHLALLLQVPGVDVAARVEAEKGSELTPREPEILAERTAAARAWLDTYAPERAIVAVQPQLPAAVNELDAAQRQLLERLVVGRGGQRRPVAGRDLHDGGRTRAARRACVRRDLPRVPRPDQRAACRLAARVARPGLRRRRASARPRWKARLRERRPAKAPRRARRHPQGRHRQGRGPGARRSRARAGHRAAAAAGRDRGLQGAAQRRIEADRRGDPVRRRRRRSGGGGAQADLHRGRREDQAARRVPRRDRGGPRPAAPAHPEPGRPGRPDRWRGGERHGPDVGRAAPRRTAAGRRGRCRRPEGGATLAPQAALGDRRVARHHRQPARRQDRGLGLSGLQGRRVGAPARAHQLVPRRPYPRERDDRDLAAGRRQRGLGARHRADPRQGGPDVRRHARRPVPGPHRRGAGHEPPPRRDPRRGGPARSTTPPTRRASGARPARPARTRAGSSASTSSTRSRWSSSSARTRRTARSSG